MQLNSSKSLKTQFSFLVKKFVSNENSIEFLWLELVELYTEKHRKYHNLNHLENLLTELAPLKNEISNWDAILFALFYHDAIYSTSTSDNEEKSAELAQKRMIELDCPIELTELTVNIILATKSHTISEFNDVNLFTDADLAILGAENSVYQKYAQSIREEYCQYPKLMYRVGRKKVLTHFLTMEKIYKTNWFSKKYENQARLNIEQELFSL